MSVKVANNRFIVSSLKKSDKLYQYLLSNISDFQRLGAMLVQEAQKAQAWRQINRLEEIGVTLSHYPIREYRLIGQYYLGWCTYREGKDAKAIFENIIENSVAYRSMALIDLATLELRAGNYDLGINFCKEAIGRSYNITTTIQAARSIAVVKSAEGFPVSALRDLEAIAPIVRYASPLAHYQYLNSLAVEFGEAGRIQEAQSICKITLASPYVIAYPEWRETGAEIAVKGYKSRSVVSAVKPPLENVIPLPVTQSSSISTQGKPARIISYARFKKKMVKKQNDEPDGENIDEMDRKDLLVKLLELTTNEDIDEEKLRKVVKYTVDVMTRKK